MRYFLALGLVLLLGACREPYRLNSNPSGATVYFDDQPIGQTPLLYLASRDMVRDHALRVELEGYEPWQGQARASFAVGRMFGAVCTYGLLYAFKSPYRFIQPKEPVLLKQISPEVVRGTTGTSPAFEASLERLERLRSDGTLTEEEYRQLREAVFRREMEKR